MDITFDHSHSLNDIAGYSVEQTMEHGKVLPEPLPRNRIEGAGRYTDAVDRARLFRYAGSYAIVRPIYKDGCLGKGF